MQIKLRFYKDNEKIVKVIAGKFENAEGPVKGHNVEPVYFHVSLEKDKEFKCDVPSRTQFFCLFINWRVNYWRKKT